MGILVLIVVGAIVGWLVSIVMRVDDTRGILTDVAIAVVAALIAGAVVNASSLVIGIGAAALLAAFIAAIIVPTAYNLARQTVAA